MNDPRAVIVSSQDLESYVEACYALATASYLDPAAVQKLTALVGPALQSCQIGPTADRGIIAHPA
jgi:hypothetical protein